MQIDARDKGWEVALEEGMTTQSSILAWRPHWMEKQAMVHSVADLDPTETT